jgi:hypothetical protein
MHVKGAVESEKLGLTAQFAASLDSDTKGDDASCQHGRRIVEAGFALFAALDS